jgi:cobalt-zinc-cadmium efflux system outer membrane protein
LPWDETLGKLLSESPEIAVAQAMVDRANWTVARAQAQRIPDIDVQATVQHDNATRYDIASLQIGVPLPIFDRNQGGIQKAQAELAAAHSNVVRLELDLKRRLAASYESYANARRRVTEYDARILPDAKESLDLVTVGYRNGEFGYLTLLTTQRTYVETNLSYLDALRQLREAAAAIDGMLLSGSLDDR